jgi:hypothetical protein
MGKQFAPKRGTLEERQVWTAARRDAWRERDAARLELAAELAEQARFPIPRDRGVLVLSPGTIAEAASVAASANRRIDALGHDRLLEKYNPKQDTMSRGFLREEARELGSPYLQFALSEDVTATVAAYLGIVPILFDFDVWYSPPATAEPRNAQRWHLDGDDTTQVKVWVHCDDVGPDSGPLTALDATTSEAFAEQIAYDSSVEYRIADDKVNSFVSDEDLIPFVGPAGTVDFVDTSRCFHFGSRVAPDAPARRIFYAQYVTPYAFKFERDHREEAPYRDLASGASSEVAALLLGAA